MRRRKDDWVNATQILKCCNIPKAKRTKILEKGVQQGLHEKIQGGYGRFQGTWIPLPDAQRLAHTYGVTPEMAPVLFFDPSNPGFTLHKKTKEINKDGTPVKRKYVKKKKPEGITPKKVKLEDDRRYVTSQHQPAYEFNPSESYNAASSKISSIPQFNSVNIPLQYQQSFSQPDYSMANPAVTQFNGQAVNDYHFQVPIHQQQGQGQGQRQSNAYNYGFQQSQSQTIAHPQIMGQFYHSKATGSQSTNDTNWSQDEHKESDTSLSSSDELKKVNNPKESYSSQLLRFFSDDNAPIPYFIHNIPYDFNINEAIDDEGHTPLHWAASIGNYQMIHLLTTKGANPLVVNNYGLNPLSKLISFNNCYELKNFPKVLDDLEICLINTDINGRTPLHYLCQFSKVKSKFDSLMYYLEIILNKLTSLTNQSSDNKSLNLMKNVLDHQDINGDSCLHLAVKAGCSKLVKILLDYNVRDDLVNINQETAKYLIMQSNLLKEFNERDYSPQYKVNDLRPPNQLETPVQPKFGTLDTPDTQRTAIQEDYEDAETARVNKQQLSQLLKNTSYSQDENKENMFLDTMKSLEMSTPIQPIHQNLQLQVPGVILEKAIEGASIAETTKQNELRLPRKNDKQSFKFIPPKLDVNGKLIDIKREKVSIPPMDFNQIIHNSVTLLTEEFQTETNNLTNEITDITLELADKELANDKLIGKLVFELSKLGVDSFNSLQEAMQHIDEVLVSQNLYLENKEYNLNNTLEKLQAYQLANLVSTNEEKLDYADAYDDKWDLAIQLTQLQIERTNRLTDLKSKVKNYGLDDKMYKYRKLISLSCGLKIDEIDSLIDGIEESLMDSH